MHDHARLHVLNPEIVLAFRAVAQRLDAGDCQRLRLFAREQAILLVAFVGRQNAPGGVGQLANHFALALQQGLLEGRQDDAPNGGEEQPNRDQGGKEDAQCKGAPLETPMLCGSRMVVNTGRLPIRRVAFV